MGKRLFHILLLSAFCLLVYLPSLENGYIWDDDNYVYENPVVTGRAPFGDIWISGKTPQYYPLVFSMFRIEHMVWGNNPAGYHAVNVGLHLANSILLYIVAASLAPSIALASALLFAVHPLQVETVAWIAEQKNLLALFFCLLSSLCLLRFYESRKRHLYLGAVFLFLCALLSKSATVGFAALPVVHGYWKNGRITRGDLAASLPFLALGAVFGLHTAYLEVNVVGASGDTWSIGVAGHIILASRIFLFYLDKAVLPLEFIFFYPRWEIDANALSSWLYPLGVLALFAAAFAAQKRTGRAAPALLLLYAAAIFPALGFFNVYPMRFSYVADHFSYIASPVIFVAVAAMLCLIANTAKQMPLFGGGRKAVLRRICTVLAVLVLAALCLQSRRLLGNYRNEIALWRSVVERNPSSYAAYNNLGTAYGNMGLHRQAAECFKRAFELAPNLARHAINLGNALLNMGEPGRAVPVLERAVTIDPKNGQAHHLLAIACYDVGLFDLAQAHFEKAVSLGAKVKPELARALSRMREMEEAH